MRPLYTLVEVEEIIYIQSILRLFSVNSYHSFTSIA